MNINTSPECIEKMLNALPFDTNEAGLSETRELIEKLRDENAELKAKLNGRDLDGNLMPAEPFIQEG